ncbi:MULTISPECIES: LysR family transcriptional regulator [Idiomarinaceae]|uniref:LysR family transcriptional regulator n=2 Tax=Pseudidiomarina TaxID=2800384 RepID=A0A368V3U2_9GAMM|nr:MULTISPECIES: LysR family transcriptional regulator [Idiomarinaceae]MRJ41224.1 LysR family transcriptional regulator [Idiomarina sp. FeN1]NCU56389.1 LysR family transcriptional regulator [Idiomarina sp. FenA--70]NCU59408.1 LysR family transcriptional regulator [Idiomarina sp. FenBw--71]PWW16182.1 LysR family transcriptional regulator [Pseudidiomarina maritima]RBP93308.1 LysR family transcriptional regulator [Pseudidiomarina tainanensis]
MSTPYRPKTTLEQWRILQAVVDHGGYAHAAQVLNKSQSSLNHAVAKLQDTLEVELLEVVGRKAQLTPIGETMVRRSRQLTSLVTELEQLAVNLKQGWETKITLAVEMVFDRQLLVPVLHEFQQLSRGTRLVIEDTVLTGSIEHILDQSADIVITHQLPKGHVGEPISGYRLDLVVSKEHPLAQQPGPISADELSQYLQIVIRDTAKKPIEVEGWLKSEQRWTVNHFNESLQLVQNGLGFSWLPPHVTRHADNLCFLTLAGSSKRSGSMYLTLPKGDTTGPCARMLYQLLIKELI